MIHYVIEVILTGLIFYILYRQSQLSLSIDGLSYFVFNQDEDDEVVDLLEVTMSEVYKKDNS